MKSVESRKAAVAANRVFIKNKQAEIGTACATTEIMNQINIEIASRVSQGFEKICFLLTLEATETDVNTDLKELNRFYISVILISDFWICQERHCTLLNVMGVEADLHK